MTYEEFLLQNDAANQADGKDVHDAQVFASKAIAYELAQLRELLEEVLGWCIEKESAGRR